MSLVRRIARPLLAAPFIAQGVRSVVDPGREIDVAPSAFEKVDSTLAKSSVPGFVDSRVLVRTAGAIAAGAGVLYATNRSPRLAAALLLGTTSIGWVGRKRIWELSGEERLQEIQAILSDAGLLGGVLLAVVDHDGRPSVSYRITKLAEEGQKRAERKQRELDRAVKSKKLKKDARKKADQFGKKAQKVGKKASQKADELSKKASKNASSASDTFSRAFDDVSKAISEQLS